MGVTLTHQQQAAVDNRGGELLVSAAAGSGKTRILVERLLNRVQQEHLDLDRFLVITYTKAAAAELRGKIMDELNDRLAADPGNAFLHRQKLVIYRAQISTIHSFCTALMREEGYRIDLQPDFRVGDDSECAVLKNRILTRVLEERYEHLEENSAFSELVDTLSAGRDDSRLQSIVLDIHTRIQSHPAPARWLADQARAFDLSGVKDVGATAWGRLLMENARRQAAYWHRRFVEVLDLLREDAALEKAYSESFDGTLDSLDDFLAALDRGWDSARALCRIQFPKLGRATKVEDKGLQEQVKSVRDKCKKRLAKLADTFADSSADLLADMERVRPVVEELLQLTADFDEAYSREKRRRNLVDFADLEHLALKLLTDEEGRPNELAQRWQERYAEIMVDEYQDTNHAQYLLVSLLAGGHGNLCVVGDDDQSIYKFRGATIENILSFEQQFGNTTVIRLEQNYRSTGTILDAANAVISRNSQRKGKTLWTENSRGEKVLYHKAADEQREAHFIAATIRKNREKGARYSDHAILYRMNALSGTLEQMFIRQGLPYRIIGGLKFFDRKEVKDVLAYLAVINNPEDTLRLRRIINEPKRGIGEATLNTAQQVSDTLGQSMYRTLQTAEEYAPLSAKAKALMAFTAMLDGIAERVDEVPLIETLEEVLEQSGYVKALEAKNDMESRGRLENIGELKTTVLKYMAETEQPTLSGFLEEIALYTDLDNLSEDDDKVVLMTLHSAKGLEFPYVFITGMEEGIFPGQQALFEPGELEEERRLAYVGITRAKKELYLTGAAQRMLFGRTTRNRPSRFISEIPAELLRIEDETERFGSYFTGERPDGGYARQPARPAQSGGRPVPPPAPRPRPAEEPFTLKVGDRVLHNTFGEGSILKIEPMGNDHLLTIHFDKVGSKRLMATYARLQKK